MLDDTKAQRRVCGWVKSLFGLAYQLCLVAWVLLRFSCIAFLAISVDKATQRKYFKIFQTRWSKTSLLNVFVSLYSHSALDALTSAIPAKESLEISPLAGSPLRASVFGMTRNITLGPISC